MHSGVSDVISGFSQIINVDSSILYKTDSDGNLVYLMDIKGDFIYDIEGNLIPIPVRTSGTYTYSASYFYGTTREPIDRITTEAVAHFYAAMFYPKKEEISEAYFPESFKYFEEVMNSLVE